MGPGPDSRCAVLGEVRAVEFVFDGHNLTPHLGVGFHQPGDFVVAIDDGAVVPAAQLFADLRERGVGLRPRQVHADLAGESHLPTASRTAQHLN